VLLNQHCFGRPATDFSIRTPQAAAMVAVVVRKRLANSLLSVSPQSCHHSVVVESCKPCWVVFRPFQFRTSPFRRCANSSALDLFKPPMRALPLGVCVCLHRSTLSTQPNPLDLTCWRRLMRYALPIVSLCQAFLCLWSRAAPLAPPLASK